MLLLSKTPEAEKVPMLMMKLAGQAQKTLIAMPPAKKADLEAALYNMKLRYVNPNRSWQSSAEFDNREWRRGEKIEDFLLDLQRLANLAFDSEEEERIKIRDQFVRGIPTWLKRKVALRKKDSVEQLCEKVAVEISLNEAYPSDHYMPHHGSYNAVLPTAEGANPDVLNLLNAIKEDQKESVNTVRQFATRIDNLQARQDKSEMEQERAFNAKDYKSNNFEPNKLRTPITGQQHQMSKERIGNPGTPAPWEVRHAQEGTNRTYYPKRN